MPVYSHLYGDQAKYLEELKRKESNMANNQEIKYIIGDANSDTFVAEYEMSFIIQDCEYSEDGDVVKKTLRIERKL